VLKYLSMDHLSHNPDLAPHESGWSQSELGPSQADLWASLREYRKALESVDEPVTEGSREDWRRAMKAERMAAVTPRTLKNVSSEHHMPSPELIRLLDGKVTLDIGAGASVLAQEIAQLSPNAQVVSLDVDHEALMTQPTPVQASADHLPFGDESFDVVLATCSLPLWADSGEQVKGSFDEAVRVTKHGGVIKIAPPFDASYRPVLRPGEENRHFVQETDPRFQSILREVDVAALDWAERAEQNPDLEVTLDSDPESMEDGRVDVTSLTIHKR
jgi:ubiquinone/menaquinone biosynthesis C-methylase UbiE